MTDQQPVTNTSFTDDNGKLSVCNLVAGSYTVSESTSGSVIYGLLYNGTSVSPAQSSFLISWKAGDPNPSLVFQNQKMELQ